MKTLQFFVFIILFILNAPTVNALSCRGYLPEIFLQCVNGVCQEAFMIDYEQTGNGCTMVKNILTIDPQEIVDSANDGESIPFDTPNVTFPQFTNGIYKVMTTKPCLNKPELIWDYFDACSRQTTIEEYSSSTDNSVFLNLKIEQGNEAKGMKRKYYGTLSVWSILIGLIALLPTLYVNFKKTRGIKVKNSKYIWLNSLSLISLLTLAFITVGMWLRVITIIISFVFGFLLLITLIQTISYIYIKYKLRIKK